MEQSNNNAFPLDETRSSASSAPASSSLPVDEGSTSLDIQRYVSKAVRNSDPIVCKDREHLPTRVMSSERGVCHHCLRLHLGRKKTSFKCTIFTPFSAWSTTIDSHNSISNIFDD